MWFLPSTLSYSPLKAPFDVRILTFVYPSDLTYPLLE
jgi:hypothetical protein